jgi:uncharacterized protein
MDAALVLSAGLLGVAGVPHCAAMCAAPCAAIVGRGGAGQASGVFHLARGAGYAAAGALAALSVGGLAAAARQVQWLLPLWSLLHAAALAFGLWLLVAGREPAFVTALWRSPVPAGGGVQPVRWSNARVGAAGALWVAWPCGLLQSALVVAGLTSGPLPGAAAMGVFALASSVGLWGAPLLWRRLAGVGARRWAARAAGALLAAASAWALGHGLWGQVSAWCAR